MKPTPEQIARRVAASFRVAQDEAVNAIIDDAAEYASGDDTGCTIALFRLEYACALRRGLQTTLEGLCGTIEVESCQSAPDRAYVRVVGASPTSLAKCVAFAEGMRLAMGVTPLKSTA